MRNFSEMDKHYDRHNEGICMICGCTTERWKSVCDACRYEAVKEENQTSLEAEIAQLQTDNRSLVEQMNQMALKPNQEIIEWHQHPLYPETSRYCIVVCTDDCFYIAHHSYMDGWLNSFTYEQLSNVKSWAYLPIGVTND